MIIQMEPTEHIVIVDDIECRLWNALTEKGTQCFVFVHRIALPYDGTSHPDDLKEFDELFVGFKPIVITEKV